MPLANRLRVGPSAPQAGIYRRSPPHQAFSFGTPRRPSRTYTAARDVEQDLQSQYEPSADQGDYYSILGVDSDASPTEIKKAFRRTMKSYHPDLSADEDSNEFAMFLNQVYETLMDPESRAEYDAIIGFAVGGINPFVDTRYAPEYAFVDEFSCIGCRNCNSVCPKTFAMEEVFGRARAMRQEVDSIDKLQESMDTCPVSCIHWVTAPQLTLLEETMGKMERIDTWILMNGGGKGANLNVFVEASLAWEKRQSERKAAEQKAKWAWAPFSPAGGASMRDAARQQASADSESDFEGAGGGAAPGGRKVNAAAIAIAARRWRDFQRAKRQRKQKLLSDGSVPVTTTSTN